MRLASIPLFDAWRELGGGPLRGKRGTAFWRRGDGYSIALDPDKGTWYDYRDGRGGGVLALVETALGCDRRAALQWLETNCGLDPSQPQAIADRRNYRQERDDADHFGVAVRALAEEALDRLADYDSVRADYTRLLGVVRASGAVLIDEYRTWRDAYPDLTQAMVRAGVAAQVRIQRRLAFFLLELADAA